jgi:hemerythrin-like domain-containing protein
MTPEETKIELKFERFEHRMTKQSLKYVTQERNQLRTALAQIAEDCTAWLHNECDEPAVDFIKAVRAYAHNQSQAPLRHTETPPDRNTDPDSSHVTRHTSLSS